MNPLRVVIVDDEKRIRKSLSGVLKLHCPNVLVVGEAENSETALETIKTQKPDVVLLDIQMHGDTGFDLLKKLNPYNFKVIFITAYDQYAVQAFKFSAVDYLLKPVVPKELVEALSRIEQHSNNKNSEIKLNTLLDNVSILTKEAKKLVLNTNDKLYVIEIKEIIRCEAGGNYTKFFLTNKKTVLISRQINEYEDLLSPYGFFRSHNSHLVNLSHVDRLEKREGELIMKDGSKSFVSSRKLGELMVALNNL